MKKIITLYTKQRDCRFPVQTAICPHSDDYYDFKGYADRVTVGIFKKGTV